MTSSVPALASLLKQTHIDDHEEVLKAANNALKQSKGDLDAQHVKLVALLKLDRYDDAIKALEVGGDKLKDRAQLEHAYALYKSGKPTEAAKIACQGARRGYKHVEAQASYRTEDFTRAAELYKELAARIEEDAEADIRVNSGAVDAQLEWASQGDLVSKKKPGREDLEAFETAYNAACGSIARGELGQGEVLLKRAKDLCTAAQDLSDEDKEAELRPITVQQVYVLAKLDRLEEAEQLSKGLDVKGEKDASTRYIAQVNSVAAAATSANPFLTHRLVTRDLDNLKPGYPFRFQSSILKQNHYAADLQAMKYAGTAKSTQAALSKQTGPSLDPSINALSSINAAAHANNQLGKAALKRYILPLLEKRPSDVGLILTICQLYVSTSNAASAINLLDSFLNRLEQSGNSADQDIRFAPGLVGTLVSLHHSQGRRGDVQSELAKAAIYWRRKSKDRPAGVTHLLKAAGGALLDSQNAEHRELAKEIFQELHERDGGDRYAAAGLLAASPDSIPEGKATLTPIDRLTAGIDATALEKAGIAQPPATGAAVTTRKRPADDDTKPKKKRIRKSKLPKDYDPNKKPDPERWLPIRDRSTYRPKGKKGKARQAMLAQGAVANESDGSRPGTPGGEIVQGKQKQGGAGGGGAGKKNKKGKGGKW